eukprot:jgi/Mesen1/9460/ME000627S08837
MKVNAQAEPAPRLMAVDLKKSRSPPATVAVDNESNDLYTVVTVSAPNRPGLLQLITCTFKDLGLDVGRAIVDLDDQGRVADKFFVADMKGQKVTDAKDIGHIKTCVQNVLNNDQHKITNRTHSAARPVTVRSERGFTAGTSPEMRRKTELLYGLMDQYIKNDVLSIQKSIVDHVEYTVARSRYKFDDFEAYQGTAYSVRDRLIESWNDTQQYFKDKDPKRRSIRLLLLLGWGRSLLNSIFNLGIIDQYSDALSQLGYELEEIAQQERDAALGNGGLGSRALLLPLLLLTSVRMATLAVVASHTINGVSTIHTNLTKTRMFTRRWLAFCNPGLGDVITQRLGTEAWLTDLDLLAGLRQHADDPLLHRQWNLVSIDAMYDIQVKRIHEYKRQLLNMLAIIHRYDCIKNMTAEERKHVVPRVCIIGGKAAPGYEMAKCIIKLVDAVGQKINNDPDVGHLLKLVFIPDYNVSVAELIIPASDLSQHISLAGNEASGTSNMKFAMNGCLILGTHDGSTVEIREEIGAENIFIFGVKAEAVAALREARPGLVPSRRFTRVVGMIRSGYFGWSEYFAQLCDAIDGPGGDFYLLANDFPSYLEAQAEVDKAYADRTRWTRSSIMSTAGSGKFSSDRTINQYATEIWGIEPCTRPF